MIDADSLLKQHAHDRDVDRVLRAPVHIEDVVTCIDIDGAEDLLDAVRELRYIEDFRTDGMRSRSRTFGSQARIPLRRDFASVAASAREHPRAYSVLREWAGKVSALFHEYHSEQAQRQSEQLQREVLPCWRLPGDMYTSGIVNDRYSLWYHRDAGNIPDSWNAMVVLSCDLNGGGA